MRKRKAPLLLFLVILAGGAMIQWVSLRTWGQNSPQSEAVDHIPLVDYETAKSNEKTRDDKTKSHRHAVGQRYDNQHLIKKNANTGGRPVLTLSAWYDTLPAIPAALSDVVVTGEIASSEALLSNDLSGVYSEFTVRVQEVLKNSTTATVVPGASITTERRGGRVKLPSGQIIRYGIAGQDMPIQGQTYLLFLKANEEQYTIVTAYQLVSGRVVPLDGEKAPGPAMKWAGDAYRGADANQFLDEVRKSIGQSAAVGTRP